MGPEMLFDILLMMFNGHTLIKDPAFPSPNFVWSLIELYTSNVLEAYNSVKEHTIGTWKGWFF